MVCCFKKISVIIKKIAIYTHALKHVQHEQNSNNNDREYFY